MPVEARMHDELHRIVRRSVLTGVLVATAIAWGISDTGGAMGNAARKARKRAGIKLTKPAKKPSRAYGPVKGLGLTSMAEIVAGIVVRGRL